MLDAPLSAAPALSLGGSDEGGGLVYTEGSEGSVELRFVALSTAGSPTI